MAKGNSISKTAIWILMGLLILGLGGFGATNLSGSLRTIGSVGDKSMGIDIYARMLQQEIRAVSAQTGSALPFDQVQAMGLDRAVLQRFVQTRALDHETAQMGLSVGDTVLRDRILDVRAFQGIDGTFDRETYNFALEQAGISQTQFETQLREEVSRTLLQGAIVGGVEMPASYVDTLVNYVGQERSFAWTRMDASDIVASIPAPDDADLRSYHAENIAGFTLPETKKITYAWLSPDMVTDDVTVSESELVAAFEARADEFNQPERRLVERLVFLDTASAQTAAAAIDAGATFDSIVAARGLSLDDIDMGDVGRLELDAAGEAVFGADVGAIVGPLPSPLGAALFRVNGILPAQITTLDEARDILQGELAMDGALRLIEAQAENLDDLMAGGATLQELAQETDMQLGTIEWSTQSADDIAAFEAFRTLAAAATTEDFPQIEVLDDGSLIALRVDEVLPPRPAPFDAVKDAVRTQVIAARTLTALRAQAENILPGLDTPEGFASAGLDTVIEEGLTRNSFVAGTPPIFMQTVFDMEPGGTAIVDNYDSVIIVRLDTIAPPSQDSDARALADQVSGQINQALAQNIFDLYAADVTSRAGATIDQRAIQAVHVNFP